MRHRAPQLEDKIQMYCILNFLFEKISHAIFKNIKPISLIQYIKRRFAHAKGV